MLLCIYNVCSYDQRTLWSLHDRLKKQQIKGEIKKRLLRGKAHVVVGLCHVVSAMLAAFT